MKTLIRNVVSVASVLAISLLPAVVSGESLADRKSDTAVETWGSHEAELERAILTESVEPTAAGGISHDGVAGSQGDSGTMSHRQGMSEDHGMKKYKSAYEYKREVFGTD